MDNMKNPQKEESLTSSSKRPNEVRKRTIIKKNSEINLVTPNKKGKINKKDLLKGLKTRADSKALEKDIDKIYHNIDMDNNGYIEYEEFVRAAISKEKFLSNENILKFAFNYFDKDNSGSIDRDELNEVFKQGNSDPIAVQKALDKIIEEVDKDKNGTIEFEEFVHVMKKMLN